MANSITWPAALLLSVLIVCVSALTWKGVIPTHALFTVAGAVLGYLVPRAVKPMSESVKRQLKEYNAFMEDEIPTKPDGSNPPGVRGKSNPNV